MELNLEEYREVVGRAHEQGALMQKMELLEGQLTEERERRMLAEARVTELESEVQQKNVVGATLMGYLKGLLDQAPLLLVLDIMKLKKYMSALLSYDKVDQAMSVCMACQSSLPDQAPQELLSRTQQLLVLPVKPLSENHIDQLIVGNEGEVCHD